MTQRKLMNPYKRRPGRQVSVSCDQLQPIAIPSSFKNGNSSPSKSSCDEELVILTEELHPANLIEAGENVVYKRQLSLWGCLEDGDCVPLRILGSSVAVRGVDEFAREL